VLELTATGVHSYFGNYDAYLQQKADQQQDNKHTDSTTSTQGIKQSQTADVLADQQKDRKKEIHNLERLIAKLESEIDKLNATFGDLEYGTPEFSATQEKVFKKESELKKVLQQWESLQK
jgi:exonuclease VII small subunit